MKAIEDDKVFMEYIRSIEHEVVTGGVMPHGDGHAKAIHDWEARREELTAKHGAAVADIFITLPKLALDACIAGRPGVSALLLLVARLADEAADNPSRLLSTLIDMRDIGNPGGRMRIVPYKPTEAPKSRRKAKVT
jgi:hypothetical protein